MATRALAAFGNALITAGRGRHPAGSTSRSSGRDQAFDGTWDQQGADLPTGRTAGRGRANSASGVTRPCLDGVGGRALMRAIRAGKDSTCQERTARAGRREHARPGASSLPSRPDGPCCAARQASQGQAWRPARPQASSPHRWRWRHRRAGPRERGQEGRGGREAPRNPSSCTCGTHARGRWTCSREPGRAGSATRTWRPGSPGPSGDPAQPAIRNQPER